MPMYEYRCNKCGEIFEELVSSDDEKDKTGMRLRAAFPCAA